MKQQNIFDSWGTEYNYSYNEILSESSVVWARRLADRGMIIFKGLGIELTDEQIHCIGGKFGQVWTKEDYHTASRGDPTINDNDVLSIYMDNKIIINLTSSFPCKYITSF
jgi:hypothetical protein